MFGAEGFVEADKPGAPGGQSVAESAGTYTLTVACAGTGTLRATFTIGEATASRTVPCAEMPRPIDISLDSPRVGAEISVELEPDADARGAAGFAYCVHR